MIDLPEPMEDKDSFSVTIALYIKQLIYGPSSGPYAIAPYAINPAVAFNSMTVGGNKSLLVIF